MFNCRCGMYEARETTTHTRTVIVCKNCGRLPPCAESEQKIKSQYGMFEKFMKNKQEKTEMKQIEALTNRLESLEKVVSKLTNMNLQQPKESVSGRHSEAPKRVVYHYRIRDLWNNISNLGGVTVVFEQNKKGVVYSGIAVCSLEDNYNKRVGINIAKTRMKVSDYQSIPSKHDFVSVVEQSKINGRTVQDYLDISTRFSRRA